MDCTWSSQAMPSRLLGNVSMPERPSALTLLFLGVCPLKGPSGMAVALCQLVRKALAPTVQPRMRWSLEYPVWVIKAELRKVVFRPVLSVLFASGWALAAQTVNESDSSGDLGCVRRVRSNTAPGHQRVGVIQSASRQDRPCQAGRVRRTSWDCPPVARIWGIYRPFDRCWARAGMVQ